MSEKIGCKPVPCVTCPYRCDVPSGIWHPDEYAKLLDYDRPTSSQPPKLFMCHSDPSGLCTGWVQCHANREHEFDLLALRFSGGTIDAWAVSKVALMEPLVKLFKTGAAAARHGLARVAKPTRAANAAVERIVKKRGRKTKLAASVKVPD